MTAVPYLRDDSDGGFPLRPPVLAPITGSEVTAEFYLLGECDFDRTLALQRRLVYETGESTENSLAILLCEHHGRITVGRNGSRSHIRLTNDQLQRQGIPIQWVARGGGCVPHFRGQLAIYPIVPLQNVGWTVGDYMRRLQSGVQAAIRQLNIHTEMRDKGFGLWGQNGILGAVGVAVQNWTTSFGAFINVNPPMNVFHFVDSGASQARPGEKATMSSLLAERRGPIKMSNVRAALIENLAASFNCTSYHVHTSHPWLRKMQGSRR